MKVVAIGAHPDDYEIGAGMRLMYHAIRNDDIIGIICTDGEMGGQKDIGETRRIEAKNAADFIGMKELYMLHCPDTHLYENLTGLKDKIEDIVLREKPSIAYVIFPQDTHQDHETVSRASSIACRDVPNIFFYKTPSSNHNSFQPHVFHVGSKEDFQKKQQLLSIHNSQIETGRLSLDESEAEARFYSYRAAAHPVPDSFAEPFSANHIILNLLEE